MFRELVEWLKQIAVFMVLCETILSFSPSKMYKRYIKPFVGLIVLFRVTVFLVGTFEVDWDKRVEDVFSDYEESVSRYLESTPIVNENEKDEILNEDSINIDAIMVDSIRIGAEE